MLALYCSHRWAQIANPFKLTFVVWLTFVRLAGQLTFKSVSGLVIKANFFSKFVNPLD